jgi:hypothetical protein
MNVPRQRDGAVDATRSVDGEFDRDPLRHGHGFRSSPLTRSQSNANLLNS